MLETKTTKIYSIKNRNQAKKAIIKAAEVINEGGLVCFPTETVYVLGTNAANDRAVADIFRAKDRSFENPVALHLHSVEEIPKYVKKINRHAEMLMDKFLPGPLMLLFEKNENVSDIITGGLKKVGIRVPRHELCLEFLEECGTPIAATPVNKPGRLSCINPQDILDELGGKIDVILDVGPSPYGIEATAIDVTSHPPRIIRSGFYSMGEIAVTLGVPPTVSDNIVPRSASEPLSLDKPKLIILEGDSKRIIKKMKSYRKIYKDKKVGIIITDEMGNYFKREPLLRKMGTRNEPAEIASGVFSILREMEKRDVNIILMEGIPREGLGRTLMIKLCRIADEVIKLVNHQDQYDSDEPEDSKEPGVPVVPVDTVDTGEPGDTGTPVETGDSSEPDGLSEPAINDSETINSDEDNQDENKQQEG